MWRPVYKGGLIVVGVFIVFLTLRIAHSALHCRPTRAAHLLLSNLPGSLCSKRNRFGRDPCIIAVYKKVSPLT